MVIDSFKIFLSQQINLDWDNTRKSMILEPFMRKKCSIMKKSIPTLIGLAVKLLNKEIETWTKECLRIKTQMPMPLYWAPKASMEIITSLPRTRMIESPCRYKKTTMTTLAIVMALKIGRKVTTLTSPPSKEATSNLNKQPLIKVAITIMINQGRSSIALRAWKVQTSKAWRSNRGQTARKRWLTRSLMSLISRPQVCSNRSKRHLDQA